MPALTDQVRGILHRGGEELVVAEDNYWLLLVNALCGRLEVNVTSLQTVHALELALELAAWAIVEAVKEGRCGK